MIMKRKDRLWVPIFLLTVLMSGARAEIPEGQMPQAWELGMEFYQTEYEEPGLMENEGVMSGLVGTYTYYRSYQWAKVEARYCFGQVDYSSRTTGSQTGIDDNLFELRGMIGYDFINPSYNFVDEDISCIPYIGVGYRYLNDNSSGTVTTTGHYGYERESNYFYSPVGIELTKYFPPGSLEPDRQWSLGGIIEYDIFWRGRQISHLSDADPSYSDPRNKQNDGYGVRGSLKVAMRSESLDCMFEPFVRYWHIGQSDDQDIFYANTIWGYGYEPKNNTTEIGCKFSLTF